MVTDGASTKTRTDQSGDFSLPAIKHWEIYWLLSEGWLGFAGTLRIEAAGYQTYSEREFGIRMAPPNADHIDHVQIVLTPGA